MNIVFFVLKNKNINDFDVSMSSNCIIYLMIHVTYDSNLVDTFYLYFALGRVFLSWTVYDDFSLNSLDVYWLIL